MLTPSMAPVPARIPWRIPLPSKAGPAELDAQTSHWSLPSAISPFVPISTNSTGFSHIFWGPELENSQDLLRGIYLKPFEALKPIVSYEPPGVIDELKAINTSFTDEDTIFSVEMPSCAAGIVA